MCFLLTQKKIACDYRSLQGLLTTVHVHHYIQELAPKTHFVVKNLNDAELEYWEKSLNVV